MLQSKDLMQLFISLGSFLETERGNGNSQLLIPFELVLAEHNSRHGDMCIRFNYHMKQ